KAFRQHFETMARACEIQLTTSEAEPNLGQFNNLVADEITCGRVLPPCFRDSRSASAPYAKLLKFGAPDKIRTCDLCLRRGNASGTWRILGSYRRTRTPHGC